MKMHKFINVISRLSLLILVSIIMACGNKEKKEPVVEAETASVDAEPFFKISLAQWSLHKAVEDHGEDPFDFAKEAKKLGIDAVEYVSQLYEKQIDSMGFEAVVDRLKQESEKHGVKNSKMGKIRLICIGEQKDDKELQTSI